MQFVNLYNSAIHFLVSFFIRLMLFTLLFHEIYDIISYS